MVRGHAAPFGRVTVTVTVTGNALSTPARTLTLYLVCTFLVRVYLGLWIRPTLVLCTLWVWIVGVDFCSSVL